MSERKYPVKRGGEYEIQIEKLAFGGAGISRIDNYVIFVKGTVPGDRVLARIQKRKTAFAEARLLSIIEPSKLRTNPPCSYFEWCGGCTWQSHSSILQDWKISKLSFYLRWISLLLIVIKWNFHSATVGGFYRMN